MKGELFMKKFSNFCKTFLKDESGQGMAEYILLLVIVIGVVLLFKGQFTQIISGKISDISSGMSGITTGQ